LSRREHRHHGIVGVDPLAVQHMPRQCLDQRTQQRRRLSHHIGKRRAAEVDIRAGVLFRLTMQRLVVAKLRHRDMSEQTGAGAATPDR
jgi:hypothetical protein